jgi:hypothetical protein
LTEKNWEYEKELVMIIIKIKETDLNTFIHADNITI